ncbi:hypothetical protein V8C44DRAFT_317928 [Trichoderma aethiopicum]
MTAARLQRLLWSHDFYFVFSLAKSSAERPTQLLSISIILLAVGANPGEENGRRMGGVSSRYCIPAETERGKYGIQTRSRLPGAVPLSELQTDCAACDGHGMNIINARIVLDRTQAIHSRQTTVILLSVLVAPLDLILQSTLIRYDMYTR